MPGQVSQELIDDLVRIGTLKSRVPFRARWMFNELGLYVQMKSWRGMTSLKAGGKFISRINLYQPEHSKDWEVKKYKPGEWQEAVKPTLELTEWLIAMEGWGGQKALADFRAVVQRFKKTGVLKLPATDEVEYFKAFLDLTRVFGGALNIISERMKSFIGLLQSGHAFELKVLNAGSTNIARQCEVMDDCLIKTVSLKMPVGFEQQNAVLLALMRAGIRFGRLTLDCHRLYEEQGLGDEASWKPCVLAKIEQCYEASGEYAKLYQEHIKILERLAKEEEKTLMA